MEASSDLWCDEVEFALSSFFPLCIRRVVVCALEVGH